MSDLDLSLKVIQWRDLIRQGRGNEITREEMRLISDHLRGERSAIQEGKEMNAAAKASKAKAKSKDVSSLLEDFKNQMKGPLV
jgi:hypothetical protein